MGTGYWGHLEMSSRATCGAGGPTRRLRDKYGCNHSGEACSQFRRSGRRLVRSNRTSPFREAETRTMATGETGCRSGHLRRNTPTHQGKCPRRTTRAGCIRRQGRDRSGMAHRSRPRKRTPLRPSWWYHWPLLSRQHRLLLGCCRHPRHRLAFQQVFLPPSAAREHEPCDGEDERPIVHTKELPLGAACVKEGSTSEALLRRAAGLPA